MTEPRLSWGSGPVQPSGWEHSDEVEWVSEPAQSHVGRIQDGLPWDDGTFSLVVSNHALQMLAWPDLVPALSELRRVLAPGGVLRLLVPDLLAAFDAYQQADAAHFQIADTLAPTLDGKLCLYVTQAGSTRSVFTGPWLSTLLYRAGFVDVHPAHFGVSMSEDPRACELDSRPDESIIYEAVQP